MPNNRPPLVCHFTAGAFPQKGQELKYYHSHRDQFSFDSKVLQAQICICRVVILKISTNWRFWMSLLLFCDVLYILLRGKKKTLSSFIRCFTIVFICKIISTLIKYFLTQGNSASWVMTKGMYWLVLVNQRIRQMYLVSQVLELLIGTLLLLSRFSRVQPCDTLWTAAHQTPLSTGFSRQEYWSGLPFPSLEGRGRQKEKVTLFY